MSIHEEISNEAKLLWKQPGQQASALRLETLAKRVKILEEALETISKENDVSAYQKLLRK